MKWLIFAYLLCCSCAGQLATDDPTITCGGWQEEPALLGTWRSYDFEPVAEFTLDEMSIRYHDSPQSYAYAICDLGGADILEVNDVRMPYDLDGIQLTLGDRRYARFP